MLRLENWHRIEIDLPGSQEFIQRTLRDLATERLGSNEAKGRSKTITNKLVRNAVISKDLAAGIRETLKMKIETLRTVSLAERKTFLALMDRTVSHLERIARSSHR